MKPKPALNMVTFTPEKLKRLKKAYEENKDADTFMFDGHEFVSRYAYYLIRYLEEALKKGGK